MILDHPNRCAFTGELTILDKPSDAPLFGAANPERPKEDTHRVIVPRRVAASALHTLIGMPLNWADKLNKHEVQRIGGIITDAEIIGDRIHVSGYVFNKNIDVASLRRDDLGMSFEAAQVRIRDMREDVWVIERMTFTGATVAKKTNIAFRDTSFTLKPVSAKVPVELAAQTGTEFIYA